MNVSQSAKAIKRDPTKYKWYQMAKGKAKFESANDEFELELKRGEKFGLKMYRGSYFLLDESDLTIQFKLSKPEGESLKEASKPFAGKIAGKKVEGGDGALATRPKKSPKEVGKEKVTDPIATAVDLEKALKAANLNVKSIKSQGDSVKIVNSVGNDIHIRIVPAKDSDFRIEVEQFTGKNSMGTNVLPSYGSVKGAVESFLRQYKYSV